METWQVIVLSLIPVYMVAMALPLAFIVQLIYRHSLAYRCVRTEDWVDENIGDNVYVVGPRGVGKTSTASAMANLLTKKMMRLAQQDMEDIREKIPDIDFDRIEEKISQLYLEEHVSNTMRIKERILKETEGLTESITGRQVFDYFFPESAEDLLHDYICAYQAFLSNNYVFYKDRRFLSRVTLNWAMDFSSDDLEIRSRARERDWRLRRYSVVFHDDRNSESNSTSENFRQKAAENGGSDAFFRIERHITKGRMVYLTTAQVFSRSILAERESASTILTITKRNEALGLSFLLPFKRLLLAYVDRLMEIREAFDEYARKRHEGNKEKLGKILARIERRHARQRLRTSKTVLSFKKDLADSFAMVVADCSTDPTNTARKKLSKLFFPTLYFHGSTDTHELSAVGDYLEETQDPSKDRFYDPEDNSIPALTKQERKDIAENILL